MQVNALRSGRSRLSPPLSGPVHLFNRLTFRARLCRRAVSLCADARGLPNTVLTQKPATREGQTCDDSHSTVVTCLTNRCLFVSDPDSRARALTAPHSRFNSGGLLAFRDVLLRDYAAPGRCSHYCFRLRKASTLPMLKELPVFDNPRSKGADIMSLTVQGLSRPLSNVRSRHRTLPLLSRGASSEWPEADPGKFNGSTKPCRSLAYRPGWELGGASATQCWGSHVAPPCSTM